MILSAIIVISVLLSILWLPPVLAAFRIPEASGKKLSGLSFILLIQVPLAASLILIADFIGLLNPAGYVLGSCLMVGVGGAIVLVCQRRSANKRFKPSGHKKAMAGGLS